MTDRAFMQLLSQSNKLRQPPSERRSPQATEELFHSLFDIPFVFEFE